MNSFSIVFSSKAHIALAIAVAAGFWVLMAHFDQLLFFSPILAFDVPPSGWAGFALSTITAVMLGIVVSMNVYIFRTSEVRIGASFFSGSTLGVISSACAGCTSAGFFMASTFGVAGAAATSIFVQYQLPLRIVSIGLLAWALYSVNRRVTRSCAIKPSNNMEEQR
ncbi:hypothetical protein NTE_01904 [Candidatus Nitrososphaera evergladensis SR1]|jgi:hypothetical protein|uniref:Uncharacterized protein n=1 Tax=Candidatus Nitrososphaera evergladensis SR1 TaxID=1459636 RepID=A0A075MS22_9ARCH|nr:hypothetical protein [Candidatus Nitrososphaera evergladensis]AIF83963.1 hypothetical protein NTE_01904 [Candidatus Nitrososphaera evergladensis SR1]